MPALLGGDGAGDAVTLDAIVVGADQRAVAGEEVALLDHFGVTGAPGDVVHDPPVDDGMIVDEVAGQDQNSALTVGGIIGHTATGVAAVAFEVAALKGRADVGTGALVVNGATVEVGGIVLKAAVRKDRLSAADEYGATVVGAISDEDAVADLVGGLTTIEGLNVETTTGVLGRKSVGEAAGGTVPDHEAVQGRVVVITGAQADDGIYVVVHGALITDVAG